MGQTFLSAVVSASGGTFLSLPSGRESSRKCHAPGPIGFKRHYSVEAFEYSYNCPQPPCGDASTRRKCAFMTPIIHSPAWLLVMILVFLLIGVAAATRRRKEIQRGFDVKVCAHCGSSQPPHAGYCRQCGQRV